MNNRQLLILDYLSVRHNSSLAFFLTSHCFSTQVIGFACDRVRRFQYEYESRGLASVKSLKKKIPVRHPRRTLRYIVRRKSQGPLFCPGPGDIQGLSQCIHSHFVTLFALMIWKRKVWLGHIMGGVWSRSNGFVSTLHSVPCYE